MLAFPINIGSVTDETFEVKRGTFDIFKKF